MGAPAAKAKEPEVVRNLEQGLSLQEAIDKAGIAAEDAGRLAYAAEKKRALTNRLSYAEAALLVANDPTKAKDAIAALRASGHSGVRARSLTELISGTHLIDAENSLVKVAISRMPKEVDATRVAQIEAATYAQLALARARENEDLRKTAEEKDRFAATKY
jgi:hypothetical protein